MKFSIRKSCSRERDEGRAQPFAKPEKDQKGLRISSHKKLFEEIKGVTYRSSQSSQKNPKIDGII